MRTLLAACLLAMAAQAQTGGVDEELRARVVSAIAAQRPPETPQELMTAGRRLREDSELSTGLSLILETDSAPARFYTPQTASKLPAVLILRHHDDPPAEAIDLFARSLLRLGFATLVVDARAHHDRLGLLVDGVTPQGLIQHEVSAALAFLASRPEIDAAKIGLIGLGFAGAMAAALNPGLAAAVVAGDVPDIGAAAASDPCHLVFGFLRNHSPASILAAIAPRPLLFAGSDARLAEAAELYRLAGASDSLREFRDPSFDRAGRYQIYRWLNTRLRAADLSDTFAEDPGGPEPVDVRLGTNNRFRERPRLDNPLPRLLGDPLPEARMTVGLNAAPVQEIRLATQSGFSIPATAYRPGPTGAAPGVGVLIAIDDRGRSALKTDEIVEEAIRRQWVVFALDPRGIGEMKPESDEFVMVASFLMGENLVWRQASDVLRCVRFLAPSTQSHRSALYARGPISNLMAAYLSAVADRDTPEWIAMRDGAAAALPLWTVPFGARGLFDARSLLAASQRKIIDAANLDVLSSLW